ncbi:beta-ketoacyl-ACP synthase III [Pontibacter akesuensis]|uniref:Beta-ketoacyl-[acyl-carrier-protein] synthase III n=1 Tax=Pontibacter akesuensis TaxID=388950 RepID=A0A1I7GJA4_9BACT|nr:beta-ketoacyl-ACP synthase III [Pontibacter akesuensis]GHA56482.1 3-oxoacyl-[acyl-carrier-protein] synthase 3 [Pontibacter akesuensis]SFU48533.1 3-oxoacyl-[acyl-carrier-protein] synthase III [Pontibacter akesuensis]
MSKITAAITGVSGHVPDYVMTNKELEGLVETNDEWITSRTGIRERRILKEEGQGTSHIAVPAVLELLKKTNTKPEEVDLLICATTTPDMVFPATANLITAEVGAVNAFGYDLQAACSGFLYALVTGSKFVESGQYKKVIIVGADKMSSIVDYTDRATCIIFGDGGGAVMLEPNTEGLGVQDSILKSDGTGAPFLHMKAGGSRKPATIETVQAREHFAFQEGQQVFKFAVKGMADVSAEVMERNNLTGDDVAWLVPHQANKRIIEATANRMGLSNDKVMLNIHKYGNTTSGTIPLCLWEYESHLKKGDNLILAAFGGGFTWGAIYLKWAYDPK